MKIAYLDTIGGIAGDMTMAAFVSAGLPFDDLASELKKLNLGDFELVAKHVRRNAIDAVHIDVVITREPHYHRHLHDILALIDASGLHEGVKSRARAIFTVIAEAEARIHDSNIDKVHFHEVGALDSLVDVVGVSICMQKFGIQRVYSSPVRLGNGGFVNTQHGIMPTPAPASLEILKDYPTVLTSIREELTTPTGAAIVKALSTGTLDEEVIKVQSIGYGAGTKEFKEIPNFLRLIVGELEPEFEKEQIMVVETNIDDMNPQVYPFLIEQLLAAGAHDAYLVPIVMKKGRPGILLSVMVGQGKMNDIIGLIYRETTTIGLRVQRIGRMKLPRRESVAQTSFGPVKAKSVVRDGKEVIAPEFEECKRIAREKGLPLLEVVRLLERELSGRH